MTKYDEESNWIEYRFQNLLSGIHWADDETQKVKSTQQEGDNLVEGEYNTSQV